MSHSSIFIQKIINAGTMISHFSTI